MARRKKNTGVARWPYLRMNDEGAKFIGQYAKYDLWVRPTWGTRKRIECVRKDGYATDYGVDTRRKPGEFHCPFKLIKAALEHGLMLLRDPSISPHSR